MNEEEKSQLIFWLTLSVLLGAGARLLEALADLLRLVMQSRTWLIPSLAECRALSQISQGIWNPASSPAGFF
jgi:hypothetical protein